MSDYSRQLLEFEQRRSDRELDLGYLQLTVALVLLIVIIYYMTNFFAEARGVQPVGPGFDSRGSAPDPNTPTTAAPSFKPPPPPVERFAPSFSAADAAIRRSGTPLEMFAPYASILAPDTLRSDAASDHSERTAQPQWFDQRSSENVLFNQLRSF